MSECCPCGRSLANFQYLLLFITETTPAVQLIVHGNPKEGETLRISCAVVHTCISSPPTLSFGDTSGDVQNNQTDLGQGYWRTESTISFPARASDQGRAVGCWVGHPGRQAAPTWVEINVRCESITPSRKMHHRCIVVGCQ